MRPLALFVLGNQIAVSATALTASVVSLVRLAIIHEKHNRAIANVR